MTRHSMTGRGSCQNTRRNLPISFAEKGVVNSRQAYAVRQSGDDITKDGNFFGPTTFSAPTWAQPTIGGIGIETGAGAIGTADSQALR
ncbi:MAG: hypothetical protein WAW80_00320 [Candidatus Saccharimonadales bacterium]